MDLGLWTKCPSLRFLVPTEIPSNAYFIRLLIFMFFTVINLFILKLVKLLLEQPYLKVKAKVAGSSSPSRLEKFLETVDHLGRTPLLDSCYNKHCATVELLVEAGADVKGADEDGNTAIILVASSPSKDQVPTKEDSPGQYKV